MKQVEKKKFKLKRIPILIFTGGIVLLTIILTFCIYLGITFSNAKINPILKEKFAYTGSPEIVQANQVGSDGVYGSTYKDLKYSYSDKVENLKVGLVCTKYTPVTDTNASGSIEFYVGLQALTSSSSITVTSCKTVVAEKWTGFSSSVNTVSSSYYSSTYLDKDNITFSSKTISVTQKFPKKFVLGMHKVENPNIYVYVQYTDKKESKEAIISFHFDDYFISGQSIIIK